MSALHKSVADILKMWGYTPEESHDATFAGSFHFSSYDLTSLEGSPEVVTGSFFCSSNRLTSLEGGPQKVTGSFFCNNNRLTTLNGAPKQVGGHFDCCDNPLTSLEGAPDEIGGDFYCYNVPKLTSLKNVHRHIKKVGMSFRTSGCSLTSHVLGLLLIKDLKMVYLDNKEIEDIINAHLDGGSMKSALDCQHALIKAGFPEFAKL